MSDRMADSYDQFKPAPAVDISPAWPNRPEPAPLLDAYQTSAGDTIVECAVCIAIEQTVAEPGGELDGGRPYRAVTYIDGTAVCRPHLRGLVDNAVDAATQAVAAVVRYAMGLQ